MLFTCPPMWSPDDYAVRRIYASPEFTSYFDSAQLFHAATLLSQGAPGRRELLRESQSSDPGVRYAAKWMMVHSGEASFLPPLLTTVSDYGDDFDVFAARAVSLYPKASWPILTRMAEQGHRGATWAISTYVTMGPPELQKLIHSPNPKARANALDYLEEDDLATAALDDRSELVVHAAVHSILRYHPERVFDFLVDVRTPVREAAAELAPRWSDGSSVAMWHWVKATSDPSPKVRQFAMLHLAPIGLRWGSGPWNQPAIRAVSRAIRSDVPEVRQSAILAARAWTLEWETIHGLWDLPTIRLATSVFHLPAFRDAVVREARSANWASGYEQGIQLAPVHKALVISQDRRILSVYRSVVLPQIDGTTDWIASLRFAPGRATDAFLIDLIHTDMRNQAKQPANIGGYHPGIQAAVTVLREIHTPDAPILGLLRMRSIPTVAKYDLLMGLAGSSSSTVVGEVCRQVHDPSWRDDQRMNLIYALAENPQPQVGAALKEIGERGPNEAIRQMAKDVWEGWRKRQSGGG